MPDINAQPGSLAAVLEKTIDNLLEGFQIINRDYVYLYANDLVAAQGKKRKEEMVGRAMPEVFPGIKDQPFYSHLKRCMEDRVPVRMDSLFSFSDGEARWFLLHMMPVEVGVVILSLDIDVAKRNGMLLEAKIRELNDITSAMTKREVRMSELKRTIADLIGIAEKQHRLN